MKETKHLVYWWCVWLKRLLTTTLHIIYRPAYHRWKSKRYSYYQADIPFLDEEPH